MWGWEEVLTLTSWLCAQHPELPSRPEPQLGLLNSAKAWRGSGENWSLSHSGQPQPVWPLQQAPTWRTTLGQLPGKHYPDPHICTGRGLRTALAYFHAACLSFQTQVSQHQRGNLVYPEPVGPGWGLLSEEGGKAKVGPANVQALWRR